MIVKNVLEKIISTEVNLDAYNGKTWVLVEDSNKALLNDFLNLEQQFIREGKIVKTMLNKSKFVGGTIYEFEPSIVQNTLKQSIQKTQEKYKLRQIEPLNLIKVRNNTINAFCEWLSNQKTDKVDVLLYSSNVGTKTLFVQYKNNNYKMILRRVNLKPGDIQDVNRKLATYNKKIASIEQKDFIGVNEGIRYTLELTKADFV